MVPLRSGLALSVLAGISSLALLSAAPPTAEHGPPRGRREPLSTAAAPRLPILFVENQGQAGTGVHYLAQTGRSALSLRSGGAEVALQDATSHRASRVRMRLQGADPRARLQGEAQAAARISDYRGSDPSRWVTAARTHTRVRNAGVYPGVDLVYYGSRPATGEALEYDFVVQPGADPGQIAMAFSGAEEVRLDDAGDLRLTTPAGELRQHRPVAYQEVGGARREVDAAYRLTREGEETTVRLALGAYDPALPLVVDPVLSFSTYYGGSGAEDATATAIDASGNLWIAGQTNSPNLTTTAGPIGPGGSFDVFVAKFDPVGSQLLFAAYLGGTGDDTVSGMAIDSAGRICLSGSTASGDFPILNGYQPAFAGADDGFVLRLNSTGTLNYATYLGGSGDDLAYGIAVDGADNLYLCGVTNSANFPVASALQGTLKGSSDCFVTCLAETGTVLLYSTYLGGTGNVLERAQGIAVDAGANAYVTGFTSATDFPRFNAAQVIYGGGPGDAFVSKIAPDGASLLYSTYVGGSGDEYASSISVDSEGRACITGSTDSTNLPLAHPLIGTAPGSQDVFVTKLNSIGSAFIYSTYLGGSHVDFAHTVRQDSLGYAYVAGRTYSSDFPLVGSLFAAPSGGSPRGFLTRLDPSGEQTTFSTTLGGSNGDAIEALALREATNGQANEVVVTGGARSADFPLVNPTQATYGGGTIVAAGDAFVSRIVFPAPSAPTALTATVVSYDRVSLAWTDNSSDESGFLVERKTGSGAYIPLATLSADTTSFNDGTVTTGNTYTYRVTATSAYGNSASTNEATATLPAGGKLKLSPKSLNFGTVKLGASKTKSFKIINAGKGALAGTVGSVGAPFTVISGGGAFQLPPKGKLTVTVKYSPFFAGLVTLAVPITSTDATQTGVSVALKGKGK